MAIENLTPGSNSAPSIKNGYLREAQNAAHQALSNYMGFWPWGNDVDTDPTHWMRPFLTLDASYVAATAESRIDPGLPKFSELLRDNAMRDNAMENRHGRVGGDRAEQLLCAFYTEFATLKDLPGAIHEPISNVRPFDIDDYSQDSRGHLGPLEDLRSQLVDGAGKIDAAYLFGSYATGDYIPGWSDVDVLLVLSSTCFGSAKSLRDTKEFIAGLQKYVYRVDPLQLHGFFVLTCADLNWYPQYYFPLVLFETSKSLLGLDQSMSFNTRDDSAERIDVFTSQVQYFRELHSSDQLPINHIDRKLFFHKIFSFPLYFLQAVGTHCYKRESFEIARTRYPEFGWGCLDEPTNWMRSRPNLVGLETVVERLFGASPTKRAMLLQSSLYRGASRFRKPLWGVERQELKRVVGEVAALAECCADYVGT